jgi:hypothetical protein
VDCGTANVTKTISNSNDATPLASCTVFSGSIAIATNSAGDIALDGIQEILGDLVGNYVQSLDALSSASIRRIDGAFALWDVEVTSLSFPALVEVGALDWYGLQKPELHFDSGISSSTYVNISITQLASISALNLKTTETVNIAGNFNLNDITLPLTTVGGDISIIDNGNSSNVNLSQLTTANTMIILDASSVALPSLGYLSGSLILGRAANFTAPSLISVKGHIEISENPLGAVTFPNLVSTSWVEIFDNPNLTKVELQQLTTVGWLNIYSNANLTECVYFIQISFPRN